MQRLAPSEQQQSDDGQLRRRHDEAGEPGSPVRRRARRAGPAPSPCCRSPSTDLKWFERHDAVRAERCRARQRRESARPETRARHHSGAGQPAQALIARATAPFPVPAAALQPERRRAIGPGERKPPRRPRRTRRREPRARPASDSRPADGDAEAPLRPGTRPEGITRFGSLMASTWRSYQSLTAWLVAPTSGPARMPAVTRAIDPPTARRKTKPQPKAHIGGNQVIGFRSSTTADGAGRASAVIGISTQPKMYSLVYTVRGPSLMAAGSHQRLGGPV